MNLVPNTRCISTTHALINLIHLYARGKISMEEHKHLVGNCMRLLCKEEPSSTHKRIFIKLPSSNAGQIPLIQEMFPPNTFTFIFNCRHPKPCLKSYMKWANMVGSTLAFKTGIFWDEHWEGVPRNFGYYAQGLAQHLARKTYFFQFQRSKYCQILPRQIP